VAVRPPRSASDAPRLARRSPAEPVEITGASLQIVRETEPQALGITYWFDAAPEGEPYSVTVHLAGKLRGKVPAGQRGSFQAVGTVERVLPGSGRVALTMHVPDLPRGTWDVTATPVQPARSRSSAQWSPVRDPRRPVATASGTTIYAPFARNRAPGARLGAWPALVTAGAGLALLVQSVLAARLGLPLQQVLSLSLVACLLGLIGAKGYYLASHRSGPLSLITGFSVQGFVLAGVGTLLGGALLLGLPLGTVLDVTAPGLLAGMAVGRLGCLFGGCCAGRPTVSRWGLWSSDRRLGVRRVPVQPMESAMAGALAVVTILAVLAFGTSSDGLVFVAAVGAYTGGRQLLFPLRSLPRQTSHGRLVTLVISCAVTLAALLVLITT
jgi:phosphatidylglycerol:prolipoprotein diacylglycerol transferase